MATLHGDALFFMHTVNAYEEASGTVVLDLVTYPDNAILDALYLSNLLHHPNVTAAAMAGARLQRVTLDVGAAAAGGGSSSAAVPPPVTLSPIPMEMPTINYEAFNTKPYRFMCVPVQ